MFHQRAANRGSRQQRSTGSMCSHILRGPGAFHPTSIPAHPPLSPCTCQVMVDTLGREIMVKRPFVVDPQVGAPDKRARLLRYCFLLLARRTR